MLAGCLLTLTGKCFNKRHSYGGGLAMLKYCIFVLGILLVACTSAVPPESPTSTPELPTNTLEPPTITPTIIKIVVPTSTWTTTPPTREPTATWTPRPTRTPLPTLDVPHTIDLEVVGQTGGVSRALALRANYLYLGVGPRLVVVDVTSPANPIVIARSEILTDIVNEVVVAGDYAYVGAGNTLSIVDIHTPAAVSVLGGLTFASAYSIEGLAIQDAIAYVGLRSCDDGDSNCDSSLAIVDINDASSPALMSHIPIASKSGRLQGLIVVGNNVYIAASSSIDQAIVNVSDPYQPQVVNTFESTSMMGGHVKDNILYTVNIYGFAIFDISDPEMPKPLLSEMNGKGYFIDGALDNGVLYILRTYCDIGNCEGSIGSVNVADPTSPLPAAGLDLGASTWDVEVENGLAYVATDAGLVIVDVSDPADFRRAGELSELSLAQYMVVSGLSAYIVNSYNGIYSIDLANSTSPQTTDFAPITSCFPCRFRVADLAVANGYIYFQTSDSYLSVISTSQFGGGELSRIPIAADSQFIDEIVAANQYVYVLRSANELAIVNAQNPATPFVVTIKTLEASVASLWLDGNTLYLLGHATDGDSSISILQVFDVTDPDDLQLIGELTTPHTINRMAVINGFAYITTGDCNPACPPLDSGLWVVDVSNLSAMKEVNYLELPYGAYSIAASGNYAYISGTAGLWIIDITNPTDPQIVGLSEPLRRAGFIAASGEYLYAASGDSGLVIYRPIKTP
jgi:hypothetical protein